MIRFRKKSIIYALLLTAAAVLFFVSDSFAAVTDGISISISPKTVTVGANAELTITSENGSLPTIADIPEIKNLRWRGTSTKNSTTVNGTKTKSVSMITYSFVVTSPGTYTIPPMTVTAGKAKIKTEEIVFNAVEAKLKSEGGTNGGNGNEDGVALKDVIFSKCEIMSSRKKFYVGEEIPLEIRVYQRNGIQMQLGYPVIGFGQKANIVFRDFKAQNEENPEFDQVTKTTENIDGKAFTVYIFRTAFRSVSTGTVSIKTETAVRVILQDNSRRGGSFFDDDSFFNPFASQRSIRENIVSECPPVEIISLPAPPQNSQVTGLTGKWKCNVELGTAKTYRVGQALALTITLKGDGTLETLKAPQLELQGFRVYPPEIEKNQISDTVKMTYTLIPLAEGDTEIPIQFCTFNPAEGKYDITSFAKKIKIEKADSVTGAAGAGKVVGGNVTGDAGTQAQNQAEENVRRTDGILYLKKNTQGTVSLPLYRNAVLPCMLLLLAGLMFWGVCEFMHARRSALANDPGLVRRNSAYARRKELIRKLKAENPQEISSGTTADINSYFADMLNLPPGSTLHETAAALKKESPEISEKLEKLAESSWMPGMKSSFDAHFMKSLIKEISKFAAVLALFAGVITGASAEDVKIMKDLKPISCDGDAMNAYDSGDFGAAEQFYRSRLNPVRPSPALIYNIGNCIYQRGDLPRALVSYELAHRLSPGDSDIRENMNLARRKLSLPEKYKINSPADMIPYVRDSLRPDNWLVVFCGGLALAFAALGIRRFRYVSSHFWKVTLAIGAAVVLISGAAYISQLDSSYSSRHAIVTMRNAPVFTLPSEKSGKVELKLKAGEEVSIEEKRMEWDRIRAGNAEGWMRSSDIAPLWNPSGIKFN